MSRILDFDDGFTSVNEPSSEKYFETIELNSDVNAGAPITLPNSGTFIVGNNQLSIYLNGIFQSILKDYTEIGTIGNTSNQIQFTFNLLENDTLTIKK